MSGIVPRGKTAKQIAAAQAAEKKRVDAAVTKSRWEITDEGGPATLPECTTLVQQIRVLAIDAHGYPWWLSVRAPGASEKLAADLFFDGADRRSHRARIVLRCMELYRSTGEIPADLPAIEP